MARRVGDDAIAAFFIGVGSWSAGRAAAGGSATSLTAAELAPVATLGDEVTMFVAPGDAEFEVVLGTRLIVRASAPFLFFSFIRPVGFADSWHLWLVGLLRLVWLVGLMVFVRFLPVALPLVALLLVLLPSRLGDRQGADQQSWEEHRAAASNVSPRDPVHGLQQRVEPVFPTHMHSFRDGSSSSPASRTIPGMAGERIHFTVGLPRTDHMGQMSRSPVE